MLPSRKSSPWRRTLLTGVGQLIACCASLLKHQQFALHGSWGAPVPAHAALAEADVEEEGGWRQLGSAWLPPGRGWMEARREGNTGRAEALQVEELQLQARNSLLPYGTAAYAQAATWKRTGTSTMTCGARTMEAAAVFSAAPAENISPGNRHVLQAAGQVTNTFGSSVFACGTDI